MRVALVHDYIKEYGGAERVLESLHEIWPEAPIYTTVYLPEFLGPHRKRFVRWKIIPSRLNGVPFAEKLISPIRILTPWIFENWDFTSYDVVIVSATGAYFPNLIVRKPHTLHICYCHTPPRYLYGYPTARNWQKSVFGKIVGSIINHSLRQIDFLASQRPDFFIANSNEVRKRIEKFYRREAEVIYPPVEISKIKYQKSIRQLADKNKKEDYYLTGGRLARAKRIELAIEACNRLKLPLKVVGKSFADYGEELRKIAGPTVEFLGEVPDSELGELFSQCQAFIYPAELEDFGIMPVEAMSYGAPVIASRDGGVAESVVDGKTGILFDEYSIEDLIAAIKKIQKLNIKQEDCIKQAKKFSKARFKKEIRNFVETKFKKHARTS
ncbi:glycosyltransferase [Candidatus Gottesmanbacteria bacterium]|nr:glycosyltransferase [Candidatus Gottesmanbacteria bacterium]